MRIFCSFGLLVVLALQVWSMSHWSEVRGINDDFCYLRQAHLFAQFGFGGLNTDVSRDDNRYWSEKVKEMKLKWNDPAKPPCHVLMPVTNKLVIQYPPGTGFVLALFPSGFQVIPLYVLSTAVVAGIGLLAIAGATTMRSLVLAAAFADLAVY